MPGERPGPEQINIDLQSESSAEDISEEERHGFTERFSGYLKKLVRPTRGKTIVLGGLLFLGGMAWWKKNEIIGSVSDYMLHNPAMVEYHEQEYPGYAPVEAQDYPVEDTEYSPAGRKKRSSLPEYGTVNLSDGTEVGLDTDWFFGRRDNGDQIEPNQCIKSMISPKYEYIKPEANDKEWFHQFLKTEIDEFVNCKNEDEAQSRKEFLNHGHVGMFVRMAREIVNSNIEYDDTVKSWLTTNEKGRTVYKWGEGSYSQAEDKIDGRTLDQIFKDKRGVCRHYAEAFAATVAELKRFFPGRFQNVYGTTINSGFQNHMWSAAIEVTGKNSMLISTFEPQEENGNFEPAMDVYKMLYLKKVMTKDEYYKAMREYFGESKDDHKDKAAIDEFLTLALYDKTPDSLAAAANLLQSILHKKIKDAWEEDKYQLGFINSYPKSPEYQQDKEYRIKIISEQYGTARNSLNVRISWYEEELAKLKELTGRDLEAEAYENLKKLHKIQNDLRSSDQDRLQKFEGPRGGADTQDNTGTSRKG